MTGPNLNYVMPKENFFLSHKWEVWDVFWFQVQWNLEVKVMLSGLCSPILCVLLSPFINVSLCISLHKSLCCPSSRFDFSTSFLWIGLILRRPSSHVNKDGHWLLQIYTYTSGKFSDCFGLKGLTCPFLNQSLKLRRYVFHLALGQVPPPFQVPGALTSLNYVG